MLRTWVWSCALAAGVLQFASVGSAESVSSVAGGGVTGEQVCAASDGAADNNEWWRCANDVPDLDLSLSLPMPTRKEDAVRFPSAPAGSEPLPVVITPGETGGSARTSLHTLRVYNAQRAARKIDEARVLAAAALPVPKMPAASSSPLEIWTSIDAQGFDGEASRKVKAGAGLDYKIVNSASAGMVAERAEHAAPGADLGAGKAEKVAAYMIFKALPAVSIDARSQWERVQTFDGIPAPAASEKASVIVAPRAGKAFTIDRDHTLEPYVEVKREIDLSVKDAAALSARTSAGAGLNISKNGSYAVNVTADVSSAAVPGEAPAINSKVQFKLPLD